MIGIGILFLFLGMAPLARVLEAQHNDWYWTHQDMKLSLSESTQHIEIYIDNQRIENVLKLESLLLKNSDRLRPLNANDFKVRINKRYELTFTDAVYAAALISAGTVAIICSFFVGSRKVGNGTG